MKTIIITGLIAALPAFAEIPDTDRLTMGANPNTAATMPRSTTSLTYKVSNLDCPGCETRVQNAVRKVPGVRVVTVSAARGEVSFTADPNARVDETAVIKVIQDEGFSVVR